jgi:ribosomal protein L11 methylase PrmA
MLAEKGWQYLAQLPTPNADRSTAFDWGTGSGCLAIALASKCPDAEIYAGDTSADALELARKNALRNSVERVRFLAGDGFSAVQPGTQFDLQALRSIHYSLKSAITIRARRWTADRMGWTASAGLPPKRLAF